MSNNGFVSQVQVSNLITMSICAQNDPRQKIGEPYTIPDEATRRLRAQLILEEALETIHALGFGVGTDMADFSLHIRTPGPSANKTPDLYKIIDGCCDLEYVTKGTLVSCGVCDVPHLQEVCQANEEKFPGGAAIFDANGKFLKPEGWEPPNHEAVQMSLEGTITVQEWAAYLSTLHKASR